MQFEQRMLDLGWIDVHAAGDHHIPRSVANVEIAVIVAIPYVANGGQLAVGDLIILSKWNNPLVLVAVCTVVGLRVRAHMFSRERILSGVGSTEVLDHVERKIKTGMFTYSCVVDAPVFVFIAGALLTSNTWLLLLAAAYAVFVGLFMKPGFEHRLDEAKGRGKR